MVSIDGEEDRPQDRTLRDTTGEFDRIGLRVVTDTVLTRSYR